MKGRGPTLTHTPLHMMGTSHVHTHSLKTTNHKHPMCTLGGLPTEAKPTLQMHYESSRETLTHGHLSHTQPSERQSPRQQLQQKTLTHLQSR